MTARPSGAFASLPRAVGQGHGDQGEEGRQGGHDDGASPDRRRLADRLVGREALFTRRFCAKSTIRTVLETTMPTMKITPRSDWTLIAVLVR